MINYKITNCSIDTDIKPWQTSNETNIEYQIAKTNYPPIRQQTAISTQTKLIRRGREQNA